MGIPKFYRWLSERYPLLNMSVTATDAPPEIDNLYLDMNGIIHNCTHANDPNLKLTETEMIVRIFSYLDKLIQIVKPKKLIFMAIDGVAPRAKMNQQRARRFKSAQERLAREREMEEKGEVINPEHAFDSNCITPGTPFMDRLGRHLRFFVRHKISENPTWQTPTVIFSGHEVPGEGEHKIMEYIRWQKRQPDYAPNQRHCMYGLDADLVMLSLVTHEPHFCLLREVVSFSGKNRGQPARETLENPCAENFILFQIGLLREYLEVEFNATVVLPWGPIEIERVVDDFVLFCMLVGNDFLPALPTLDIAEGALNNLIDTYKRILPRLGGYLTYAGQLNHARLEMLLREVGALEMETLSDRAADTEWFENKRSKRRAGDGRPMGNGSNSRSGSAPRAGATPPRYAATPPRNSMAAAASAASAAAYAVLGGLGDAQLDDIDLGMAELAAEDPGPLPHAGSGLSLLTPLAPDDVAALEPEVEAEAEAGPTMMSREARNLFLNGDGEAALQAWKDRWYTQKLKMPDSGPLSTAAVVQNYLQGLHWVLEYYYRGVASWDWFYPYHYAPLASDMVNLESMPVSFERGKPFQPYQQLLAVLPTASANFLPAPYQRLMLDPNSPIRDFYPEKWEQDMEGKRAEWEAIVLIPFISETRLLAAEATYVTPGMLTADEQHRNRLGDMLVFQHVPDRHEPEHCSTTLPQHFSSVIRSHSVCRNVPPPAPLPEGELGFKPLLVKGTRTGKHNPPGFPTLKTIQKLKVELKAVGVNVLGNPSKKESCILLLPDVRQELGDINAERVKFMVLERVYVKWPYLQEAQVMSVSDAKQEVTVTGVKPKDSQEAGDWSHLAGRTKNLFLTKMGMDVGNMPVLLHVRACTGHVRNLDGVVTKTWAKEIVPYPLQAVLRERPSLPAGFADPSEPKPLIFTPGDKALFLGSDYYGGVATILEDSGMGLGREGQRLPTTRKNYTVKLQAAHKDVAALARRTKQIVQEHQPVYMPSPVAASRLGMNPGVLGRITGSVWLGEGPDRADIGLCVKNAKEGLCVPGYSQPSPDSQGWMYTSELVQLVDSYRRTFPWIFRALQQDGARRWTIEDLFPELEPAEQSAKLQELKAWLKALPTAKRPLVKTSVKMASDAAMQHLMAAVGALGPRTAASTIVELENVDERLLLPSFDPTAPLSTLVGGVLEPGDRIVSLRSAGVPAFGMRGTVVAVFEQAVEVIMDEEFPGGTTLGGRLRVPKGGSIPRSQVLNISHIVPIRIPQPTTRHKRCATSAAAPKRPLSGDGAGAAAAAAASAAAAAALAQQSRSGRSSGSDGGAAAAVAGAMQGIAVPGGSRSQGGAGGRDRGSSSSGGRAEPPLQSQPQHQHQQQSSQGRALLQKLQRARQEGKVVASGPPRQDVVQHPPGAAAPPAPASAESLLRRLQQGGREQGPPPGAAPGPYQQQPQPFMCGPPQHPQLPDSLPGAPYMCPPPPMGPGGPGGLQPPPGMGFQPPPGPRGGVGLGFEPRPMGGMNPPGPGGPQQPPMGGFQGPPPFLGQRAPFGAPQQEQAGASKLLRMLQQGRQRQYHEEQQQQQQERGFYGMQPQHMPPQRQHAAPYPPQQAQQRGHGGRNMPEWASGGAAEDGWSGSAATDWGGPTPQGRAVKNEMGQWVLEQPDEQVKQAPMELVVQERVDRGSRGGAGRPGGSSGAPPSGSGRGGRDAATFGNDMPQGQKAPLVKKNAMGQWELVGEPAHSQAPPPAVAPSQRGGPAGGRELAAQQQPQRKDGVEQGRKGRRGEQAPQQQATQQPHQPQQQQRGQRQQQVQQPPGPQVQQPEKARKVRRNSIGQWVLVEDEPAVQQQQPAQGKQQAGAAKVKKGAVATAAGTTAVAATAAGASGSAGRAGKGGEVSSSGKAGGKGGSAGASAPAATAVNAGAAAADGEGSKSKKKKKKKDAEKAAAGSSGLAVAAELASTMLSSTPAAAAGKKKGAKAAGVETAQLAVKLQVEEDGTVGVALTPAAAAAPGAAAAARRRSSEGGSSGAGARGAAVAATAVKDKTGKWVLKKREAVSGGAAASGLAAGAAATAGTGENAVGVRISCGADGRVNLDLSAAPAPAAAEEAPPTPGKRTATAAGMPASSLEGMVGIKVKSVKKAHKDPNASNAAASSAGTQDDEVGKEPASFVLNDLPGSSGDEGTAASTLQGSTDASAAAAAGNEIGRTISLAMGVAGADEQQGAGSSTAVVADAPLAAQLSFDNVGKLQLQLSLTKEDAAIAEKEATPGLAVAAAAPVSPLAAAAPPAAAHGSSPAVAAEGTRRGRFPSTSPEPRRPGSRSSGSGSGACSGGNAAAAKREPRIPDGTRGFTWGRGKQLSAEAAAPGSSSSSSGGAAEGGSLSAPSTPPAGAGTGESAVAREGRLSDPSGLQSSSKAVTAGPSVPPGFEAGAAMETSKSKGNSMLQLLRMGSKKGSMPAAAAGAHGGGPVAAGALDAGSAPPPAASQPVDPLAALLLQGTPISLPQMSGQFIPVSTGTAPVVPAAGAVPAPTSAPGTPEGQQQQEASTSSSSTDGQAGSSEGQQQQAATPERGGLNLLRMLRGSMKK